MPVIIKEDDAEFLNATFDSRSMSDGVPVDKEENDRIDPVEAKKQEQLATRTRVKNYLKNTVRHTNVFNSNSVNQF